MRSRQLVEHPIYEAYKVNNINGFIGYRVKLYCIFADNRVYSVFNQSDWIDNVNLMRENGTACSTFTHDIYVTPTQHFDIFSSIRDYVSASDSN